ncbi:TraB/VirB10 family protein [Vibrio navarrensis]|nr:TraB/VirB10 family protein [Vibrio navarrensis]
MQFIKNHLSPSQLGKIYVVGGVVAIFTIAIGVMVMLEPEKKVRAVAPEVENIITNRSSREFGIEAVNAKVVSQNLLIEKQKKEAENLKRKVEELEEELEKKKIAKADNSQDIALKEKMNELQKQIEILQKQNEESQDKQISYPQSVAETQSETKTGPTVKHPSLRVDPERRKVTGSAFSYGSSSKPQDMPSSQVAKTQQQTQVSDERPATLDRRTENLFAIVENEQAIQESEQSPEIYLPSGSILTGVLITGLDAPTTAKAANEPIPVLVRIKKEAILPNYQTLEEVNECFALMAGYGDLSSERAMLRGESISCVKHDKTVIEANFKSFAVGEDGKNGLKGTLVTRNSTVLANSMMAGFAAGLASMFDVSPVPVISTDNSGKQQYQEVFNTGAIQGGAAKGASNAMNKLADYYMRLADSMHPVIEIGAGRVVDMIVTSGTELTVSERKKG